MKLESKLHKLHKKVKDLGITVFDIELEGVAMGRADCTTEKFRFKISEGKYNMLYEVQLFGGNLYTLKKIFFEGKRCKECGEVKNEVKVKRIAPPTHNEKDILNLIKALGEIK